LFFGGCFLPEIAETSAISGVDAGTRRQKVRTQKFKILIARHAFAEIAEISAISGRKQPKKSPDGGDLAG
jgi:hypothetical protein